MSDYFTRLAERTLGATPLPRPVIPSRFERPSATGFDELDLETVALPESPRQVAAGSPPRDTADQSALPLRPDGRSPGQHTRYEESAATERLRGPLPAHNQAEPAAQPAIVERVTTHERDHVTVERATIVVTPPGGPTPVPAAHAAVTPQRLEARPVAPPPPIVPQPATRETLEDAAGPPVIHVTIGRIDVRAVSTPPPSRERPHPQRPARPSLEEYLRRGGGRP